MKNSYGGAQPNISSKWLEKRVIGIPSLTEQKKIVVILDKLVTMINKKKKQINLLEELVKSRFLEVIKWKWHLMIFLLIVQKKGEKF